MIEAVHTRLSSAALKRCIPPAPMGAPADDSPLGTSASSLPGLPLSDIFQAAARAGVDTPPPDGAPSPSDPQAPPMKKWTILVYAAADNNLYPYEYENLRDIEKVGSTDQLNVVTQFDEGGPGASRMLMQKVSTPDGSIGSPVVENIGEVDMASPETLSNFIKWGMEKYPAEHTMLIINDHGNGWRGCVQDEGADTFMTLPTVREGLEAAQAATGKKLDVIGFDACLMGMAEVAHELRDCADFMVGSQETEGAAGWPYSNILTSEMLGHLDEKLAARLPMAPRDVAVAAVQRAAGLPDDLPTMAAYDLSKEGALKSAVDVLAQKIEASPITSKALKGIAKETQGFYEYKDLYDFADRLQGEKTAGPELSEAAAQVKGAIDGMVIASQHNAHYPGAHGVSIELTRHPEGYSALQFAQDGGWMTAQDKIGLRAQAC